MKSFVNFSNTNFMPKAAALGSSSLRAIIDGIIIRVLLALGIILIGEKYSYTEIRGV